MDEIVLLRALASKFDLGEGTDEVAASALRECADYIDRLRTIIQIFMEEPSGGKSE